MNKLSITIAAGTVALAGTSSSYAGDQDITFEEGFDRVSECAKLETFDAAMEGLKKIPSPKPESIIIINDNIIKPNSNEKIK